MRTISEPLRGPTWPAGPAIHMTGWQGPSFDITRRLLVLKLLLQHRPFSSNGKIRLLELFCEAAARRLSCTGGPFPPCRLALVAIGCRRCVTKAWEYRVPNHLAALPAAH